MEAFGTIPEHLKNEPFVRELADEITALVHENGLLHQRLKVQSATIDKFLQESQNKSTAKLDSNGDVVSLKYTHIDGDESEIKSVVDNVLLSSPPPAPPSPPPSIQFEGTSTARQVKVVSGKNRKFIAKQTGRITKKSNAYHKPIDAIVMMELERLHMLKKTGKMEKFPDTFAARIRKREKSKENQARREDRGRYHEIDYNDDGEPVNDSSLYAKAMRVSPMKQVEPSERNQSSNMSHTAHLKGAKANHAHEIMSAVTVADRARVMSEKTLKTMAFGRRESAVVGRHGYQLMHHNLGAEAFMGETYAGNLSPFSHATAHTQRKLEHVQNELAVDKMKRSQRNAGNRFNTPKSNNMNLKTSETKRSSKRPSPMNKAFGRRVSVGGSRSAHLVTHHLLGANSFVGEHYNQYHSVKTGRIDKKMLRTTLSPEPQKGLTLQEIAEEDSGAL
eukprot:g1319.t1